MGALRSKANAWSDKNLPSKRESREGPLRLPRQVALVCKNLPARPHSRGGMASPSIHMLLPRLGK